MLGLTESLLLLPLLLLLAGCGSTKGTGSVVASAPGATSSSLGSGTVIDGDGKIYEWTNTTQRALVTAMLEGVRDASAQDLAGDARCLVYAASVCTDHANFTAAQRLVAATLAIEAAKLALDNLSKVKIHLTEKPPIATGDDGRDTPVNARVSPDDADTIDIWFDYAKEANEARDLVTLVDFQHTLIHELIHMQATAGQGGNKVGDGGNFGGVTGRRLVNRAAADIVGDHYNAMPTTAVAVTLDVSPQVGGDIDGRPNDDTITLPFEVSFGSFSISKVLEIAVPGGSYKLNGDLDDGPAGTTTKISGTATLPLRAATAGKLRVRAKDETGREVIVEKTLAPRIKAPTLITIHRFIHNSGTVFGYTGDRNGPPADWTYEGPAFLVPQTMTRSCKKPLHVVNNGMDQYFSASGGVQFGYSCDATSITKPLYELTGPRHLFSADQSEVNSYLQTGLYTNRGSFSNVIR